MLSNEAKVAIDFSRKNIKPDQGNSLTPEIALEARKETDAGNQYQIPNDVKLSIINDKLVKGEFYLRNSGASNTVLMFLHGGAYATGTVYSRRKLAIKLGKASNVDVFSVDYTQYPEGRHPTAQNDVINAYHFLEKKYKHILVFGESAGATLALTLTLQLKQEHKKLPDRIAVFSPVINQLNTSSSEYLRNDRDPMLVGATKPVPYFEDPSLPDPLVSPIYGNYSCFPPIFINCGSEEVKYDSSAILNELCQEAHVDMKWKVWNGLFHVFVLFDMPETDLAINQIGSFFKAGFNND